ncbi:MAG: molecular chaperone TorD family protein [Chloroflexi bacterium]|nr:molecular chaperone TorD family protein [Chloroflexota bacterium]
MKRSPIISDGLAPKQAALARRRSYKLLSQLLSQGLTKETLPLVQAVSDLAGYLPERFNFDEAAAVHYQLFDFNLFPFETIFLDDSGLLGGRITESVAYSYHAFGFQVETAAHNPDHIRQELAALSFLCLAETDALAKGDGGTVVSHRRQQIKFLQHHLLRWLSPFVLAVQAQKDAFYTAVAHLTLALIYDHYQDLLSEIERVPEAWTLPTPPDFLADDKTGLKEIAAYFMMPAYSGIFVSRDNVGRLARQLNLPRGFGDRQQMLSNLMHTAVQYDLFPALLNGLETTITDWQKAYHATIVEMPLLEPFTAVWSARTQQTLRLLTHMQTQLKAAR